ncbi:MAG: hypothetical protein PHY08_08520 [Candidatus Cloacimonetes bacterium]|nr:hypothetical protein [Candidatus Cloacimonadota bacterium]
MKKLILFIFLCITFQLNANIKDNFLIGDYSNIYDENYLEYMKQLGVNTLRLKTYYNKKYYKVPKGFPESAIDKMNQQGFNVVIWDNQGGIEKSPYYNSYANFYKFEAEYTYHSKSYPFDQGLNIKDDWFYSFNHYKNVVINENDILIVPQSKNSIVVFNQLNIRENMPLMNLTTPGYLKRFIYGFPISLKQQTDIFIKFKMKIAGDIDINQPICKIGFVVAIDNFTGLNNFLTWDYDVSKLLQPTFKSTKTNVLYYDDFNDKYTEFEYKLNITELKQKIHNDMEQYKSAYLKDKNNPLFELIPHQFYVNENQKGREWRPTEDDKLTLSLRNNRIHYFSPYLTYYNNGILSIDYIEIYDNLYQKLDNKLTDIKDRMTYFEKYDNVIGFDTYDEPLAFSFESYKKINELTSDDTYLHTAITSFGHPQDKEFVFNYNYSNIKHFNTFANPKILCPDAYLYGNPTADYNSSKVNELNHIQSITEKICNYYNIVKTLSIETNKPFIPIVHIFGQYDFKNNKWNKIMTPPNAQQKMLLLLPLCYGANGLWMYKTATEAHLDLSNPEGERQISLINFNKDSYEISFNQQYETIKNTLSKVKQIASLLHNAQWIKAETIQQQNILLEKDNYYQIPFSIKAKIKNVPSNLNYQGFIEYGLYKNDLGNIYLMLVNRRTNEKIENNNQQYFNVNDIYKTASPQSIELCLSETNENYKLTNPISKEVFFQNSNNIYEISINAGEGILIEIKKIKK